MKDEFPQRKSPRAKWCEYNEGLYFVTVCTRNMKHHFGKIENGAMTLTRTGVFLTHELKNASLHHPHVEILQYVVMPNHFHAIVKISPPVGTQRAASESTDNTFYSEQQADAARCVPTSSPCKTAATKSLLSCYVASLKSVVTRYAHSIQVYFAWQPRYHDHVIRGIEDGNNIAQYIKGNIANWERDCFY